MRGECARKVGSEGEREVSGRAVLRKRCEWGVGDNSEREVEVRVRRWEEFRREGLMGVHQA